ncbi:MAG: Tim44/TimA family putative adaptor protein [Defluviicoccus sp.]|nr:Tim44/TimA family putative adaptor protein [Defluviicoccus sp.]MDE0276219.1 Tim44/TimA family putative adaptor protein [Defluviicoccus sp.]
MEGFQFLDIIFFAMIAAFLVFRLRSVLGRRTGHQSRPPDNMSQRGRESEREANVIELPDRSAANDEPDFDDDADFEPAEPAEPEDPVARGLARIGAADPDFDPATFEAGAKAAFEAVVHAFATADTGTLRALLNDDVFENFEHAIRQRLDAAETLETTVVGIKSADIVEAEMSGRYAFVTVTFVSEQVNVTRDAEGEVIEGDPAQVADVTDIWTFSRNTRSRDPNWKLIETRSSN